LLLAASVLVAVSAGPSALAPAEVLGILLEGGGSGAAADIVLRVRLPRVLLGLSVGASLAVAGVLFQAILRNPLADPFVLGVSGGAALGGIAVLSLGSALGLGYAAVPPAAFAGAVLATLLLYAVAGTGGRVSGTQLLLTGVVFNAFASAAIVFLAFLASLAGLTQGTSIFLWLIGSLSAARGDVAGWVALFLALGLASALPLARGLNLLVLGDESAAQLGVDAGSCSPPP
jgi:iron complex transport system permease protein